MTGTSTSGAWGGSAERKRSVVATVSAAVSGNVHALPSSRLYFLANADCPEFAPFGNGYCMAFGTVDPTEIEARSGLPVGTLLLVGGALASCWERNYERTIKQPYVTPVAKDCLVDALEAIQPGADVDALPVRYVVALLRGIREVLPPPDGADDAPLPSVIQRVARLHADAQEGRVPDAAIWSEARREAVVATDVATTSIGRAIGQFVESVVWPMDALASELPGIVERFHYELVDAEQKAGYSPELRDCLDRADLVFPALTKEAASMNPSPGPEWVNARLAEHPDILAAIAPEIQDRLVALACAACDKHGPRAYRLLIDTLKQL